VAFMAALSRIELEISRSYYLLWVPLLFFALLIPYPYSIGPWVLTGGLVLHIWGKGEAFVRRLTPGILFSGLVMTIMACFVPVWYYLGCHGRGLPQLAALLSHILSLLGADAASSGHTLFVRCAENYRLIQITADSMGLLPGLFVSVGIFICWISNAMDGSRLALSRMMGIWVLYMFARYIVLVCIFIGWHHQTTISMMWNPVYNILSFMPLAVFLANFSEGSPLSLKGTVHLTWVRPSVPSVCFMSLIAVSVAGAVFGGALTDPGKEKIGRVLIDEGHSEWENTMKALDTGWYGQLSTYNYYSLRKFLENYYRVGINTREITSEVLMFQDVVILKCPTRPYKDSEQEALVSFVNKGGGLFLVGDHTDVFGSSTFLNALAGRLGFSFNKDGQWDICGDFSVYSHPKTLGHPVGKQTPEFLFATGCTLSAPLWAEKPVIGYGMMTREADYSKEGFFPDNTHLEDCQFGVFLQATGGYHGKGRVLCFSDSTVWSGFSMFLQGKPELLLDCLSWLNRSNTGWASAKPYILLLSWGLFVAGVAFQLFRPGLMGRHHAAMLTVLFVSIPFSSLSVDRLNEHAYTQPKPLRDFKKILFVMSHSDMFLANRFWFPPPNEGEVPSYDAFYVAVQRLSMVPQIRNNFLMALEGGNHPIVIVNPCREFSEREISVFQRYIRDGGRALILDSSGRGRSSFSWQLSKPFGMEIAYDPPDLQKEDAPEGPAVYLFSEGRDAGSSISFATSDIGPITGGQALLWYLSLEKKDAAGSGAWEPCLSEVLSGKGKVWLCTLSRAFSDTGLGTSSSIPDKYQQNIYKLVYQILNGLAEL